MKKRLRKILLISLFFSASVPSAMQAMEGEKTSQEVLDNYFCSKIECCDVGAMERILEDGVVFNWQDGYRVLMQAAKANNFKVVKLLLARNNIDINRRCRPYPTVLIEAAQRGHFKVVELLLATEGIDVDQLGMFDYTALIKAAIGGHSEVAELLLAKGADPSRETDNGCTALSLAVENARSEVVRLLIPCSEVNWQDKSGSTPLILAAKWENSTVDPKRREKFTNIIDQIVAAGVDPFIKNNYGTAAWELSKTVNCSFRALPCQKPALPPLSV